MSRTTRFVAAALAAAAVLPAAAQAAPASGAKDVAHHLQKATTAGERLEKLVAVGKDRSALLALRTTRRETATAARDARRLASRASTDAAVERAVWALAASGAAQAASAETFAGLLDDADGGLQQALALGLPSSLASRDAVIAALTTLIARISDPELQALATQALSALAAQTPATMGELAAIPMDELPARISAIVQTALQAATAALDLVTQKLASLIPTLPAAAQGPVQTALGTVSSTLTGLTPMLTDLSATIGATVQGILDMVGALMPRLPGATGAAGGTLGGLIPDLGTIVPGFGGLLDGLLGDL